MEISIDEVQGRVAVTILVLHGDLDGSNYQTLITTADKVYQSGTTNLILDLSQLNYMSSAGLVALHAIAKLLQGGPLPDPNAGWEAFHAIERDQAAGTHSHLKLLSSQGKVDQVLVMTGMKSFFDVYTDRQAAIAACG